MTDGTHSLKPIIQELIHHLEYIRLQGCSGLSICEPKRPGVPVRSGGQASLSVIQSDLGDCQRCPLSRTRQNIVFGQGNHRPELVFIGEAPGRDEDLQGIPFVGAAGQLLTRIIAAMGLEREDVYITNIVKCRPPGNRDPEPAEIDTCSPFLVDQLHALNPKIICALGRISGGYLTGFPATLSAMRGRIHEFQGIPVIVTYHPAAILRNRQYRRPVWEDMKTILDFLDRTPPG